jgi:hypothetical protein
MFLETAESDTGPQTGLDSLVSFISRILTPDWVKDLAEELAEAEEPRT